MDPKRRGNPVKTIGMMLVCLLTAVAVGTLLLFGAYCLPTEPIAENVRKSAPVFAEEDTYQILFDWCTSMLDNFTDAYMLLSASDQTDGSVPERALMNYPGIKGRGPNEVLVAHYIDGKPLPESIGYARYWHGYEIWLKPMLSVTTYQGIRIINGIVQAMLVLLTCFLLYRKHLKHIIVPFILTYLMLMPLVLAEGLQFSACFYVAVFAMLILLSAKRIEPHFVFLLAGIGAAFFDLLSYPVFTFGMPAVLYFAMNPSKTAKEDIFRFIWIGFCWVLGFAGMGTMKWVVATLATGHNAFADALFQLKVRTSDLAQDTVTHISLFTCIAQNVLWFIRTPATLLTGAYCLWNCLPFSRCGRRQKEKVSDVHILPYLLIALVPFAWFAVTINHSYMHIFFVSKTLAASVFAASVWITGFYARFADSRRTRKQTSAAV